MAVPNTKTFSYLADPQYRKIFLNKYEKEQSWFDKLFKIETVTKGNWIAEAMLSPLGGSRLIMEGNPVEFDTAVQGYPVKKYFNKYGLGFQITEEMQDDDLTGLVKQLPAELGTSLAYARETTAVDLLNNGHTAALYTGMDGKAIFATNHGTLKAPSVTQANTTASGASLSETSLQAALDVMSNWLDEAGRPIHFAPKYLVVPMGLRWMAETLLKTSGRPFSANNDVNATTSIWGGIQPFVHPLLTSTTAWYILCEQHDLRFTWRKTAKFESGDDFSTGNALFKTTARWVVWAYDWRGAFRNAGA
jgi:hypothetical protein